MSEKRKDSKGRILKTGESQRKDGLYQYRYKDITGERRTIYASELKELREKEKEIEKMLQQGISSFDGAIPLSELLDKVFVVKQKWKDSTRESMHRILNLIKKTRIYQMPINKIKMMDCKTLCVDLQREGYSYQYISSVHKLLKMAFTMACDDDLLVKNPCNFGLNTIIEKDGEKIESLSQVQIDEFKQFLCTNRRGAKWIDIFEILLGTGMRISEFAALTINDIDFERNVIHVRKQIQRLAGRSAITETKSKSGTRDIPMTTAVSRSVRNMINERKKVKIDVMVDGHVGFISVTRRGRPKTASEYEDSLRYLVQKYNETATNKMVRCTPHVLRHTFCTRCIAVGMDVKTVQYLMGHSNASTTLNIYADAVPENVMSKMKLLEVESA